MNSESHFNLDVKIAENFNFHAEIIERIESIEKCKNLAFRRKSEKIKFQIQFLYPIQNLIFLETIFEKSFRWRCQKWF